MVLEYLRCCPPSADVRALQEVLRAGEVTGATALAPAIADLAGHGQVPVLAEPDGDGWRLSGRISWASNLFDDAVVVTPARTPQEGRVVVLFRLSDAGVDPGPVPELLGLNGTGTRPVALHDVAVPRISVLSNDLASFMALCRPPMLLMQAALAVGVADASLAASGTHLTGVNAVLRRDHEDLSSQRDDVAIALDDQAASRAGIGPAHLARTRLDAIDVATRAVALETAVCGGSAYRTDSATGRRVREVAFLPVQAPTLAQLRLDAGG
jgi:alkylation response protein AidB-like acyl-CoA dehydrogenase